jgi:hypothetical protein
MSLLSFGADGWGRHHRIAFTQPAQPALVREFRRRHAGTDHGANHQRQLFGADGFIEAPPFLIGALAIGLISGSYQGEVSLTPAPNLSGSSARRWTSPAARSAQSAGRECAGRG